MAKKSRVTVNLLLMLATLLVKTGAAAFWTTDSLTLTRDELLSRQQASYKEYLDASLGLKRLQYEQEHLESMTTQISEIQALKLEVEQCMTNDMKVRLENSINVESIFDEQIKAKETDFIAYKDHLDKEERRITELAEQMNKEKQEILDESPRKQKKQYVCKQLGLKGKTEDWQKTKFESISCDQFNDIDD